MSLIFVFALEKVTIRVYNTKDDMKLTETNLIKLIDEIKLTIEPNADKIVNAIAKSFLELLNEKDSTNI